MKDSLLKALLLVGALEATCKRRGRLNSNHAVDKIVGGYNATIQDYPYQAYMLMEKGGKYYQCGGSLISARYVLTAAHCLVGVSALYVRIGSTESDSGGHLYYTTFYKAHPRYDARTSDYDVAVVDLRRDARVDGRSARVIALADQRSGPGAQLTVSGWGTTSEGGQTSPNLMAVKVAVVSPQECRQAYGSTITSRMLCAGYMQGGKDSCQGDSGGPAAIENGGRQAGIVSFGNGCARAGYPGVYTDVAAVRSWIKANTGV